MAKDRNAPKRESRKPKKNVKKEALSPASTTTFVSPEVEVVGKRKKRKGEEDS